MMDKICFNYTFKEDNGTEKRVTIDIPTDIDLTHFFAYFIELTRMIGYYPESWRRVIEEFAEEVVDKDFNVYEMANSIMYE